MNKLWWEGAREQHIISRQDLSALSGCVQCLVFSVLSVLPPSFVNYRPILNNKTNILSSGGGRSSLSFSCSPLENSSTKSIFSLKKSGVTLPAISYWHCGDWWPGPDIQLYHHTSQGDLRAQSCKTKLISLGLVGAEMIK